MNSLEVPRKPLRTVRRTILLGLGLGLVLGLIAVYWAMGILTDQRLHRAEATADRLDPGWRLSDLLSNRETLSDEENSALVVLAAIRNMPSPWPPLPPRDHRGLVQPYPGGKDPINRADDLPNEEQLDPWLAIELREALDKVPEALTLARKVADMDRGRYPLAIAPNITATLLPHAQDSRSVARLLKADAILKAHDGDLDGAIDSCRAEIQTGRALGDEPFAISQLVRMAIVTDALDALERILAQGQPSDAALARIEATLLLELRAPVLLTAIRGERALMDDLFTRMTTGQVPISAAGAPAIAPIAWMPGATSFYRYNHALVLETMNQAVEVAKRPDAEQIDAWVDWERDIRGGGQLLTQFAQMLKRLLMPAVSGIGEAHLRQRASVAAAVVMVAAERERRLRGTMPSDLTFLANRSETRDLRDPFDGLPLRCKSEPTGLTVYTVGFDRQDNGGKFDPRRRLGVGTDLGLKLVAPEFRGVPSSNELPKDVFQRESDDRDEDEL